MNVPILMYHHVVAGETADRAAYEISLAQFEHELDLLRQWGFETVGFDTLFEKMDKPRTPGRRMVLITFDDAFTSFRELALPALQQRGMMATVFVPAGYIGQTNEWDRDRNQPVRQVMNETELADIAKGGMAIGSHGWRHRSLPDCNEAEAREEVFDSRARLREMGFGCDVFAYPYGKYSARAVALLESAGYAGAVSIFSNEPSVTANRFAMRRIYVHPGDGALRFRLKLTNSYLCYQALRQSKTVRSA